MKYKFKRFVFRILDNLPEKIAEKIYREIQFRNGLLKILGKKVESYEQTLFNIENELKTVEKSLKETKILEVGSEFLPIGLYLLVKKFNCLQVVTYDIRKRYSKNSIKQVNAYFDQKTNHFYQSMDEIVYLPGIKNFNVLHKFGKFDVIFSRNVLEHVNNNDIVKMHEFFKGIVSKNGVIVHQISPSDHRSFSDDSISLHDFLKYSDSTWNKMCMSFDYHNRLRLPDYLHLFKNIGFKVLSISYDYNDGETLPPQLNGRFNSYSVKELTAGSILLIMSYVNDQPDTK